MNSKDFSILVDKINRELSGKTISHATYAEWGMGYSVTLFFTDGTATKIVPEHDEGFDFVDPDD
jgi:hypothetical protein